eukprot:583248-Hanusia_phi.AAC.1
MKRRREEERGGRGRREEGGRERRREGGRRRREEGGGSLQLTVTIARFILMPLSLASCCEGVRRKQTEQDDHRLLSVPLAHLGEFRLNH